MTHLSRRRFGQLAVGTSLVLASRITTSLAAQSPIDQSGFIHIGGIDQWIAIQGKDRSNPAILYLHGGPGEAQSPFLDQFKSWEHDFTVVNWDQRGSGKTYERNGEATMQAFTLDRVVND